MYDSMQLEELIPNMALRLKKSSFLEEKTSKYLENPMGFGKSIKNVRQKVAKSGMHCR